MARLYCGGRVSAASRVHRIRSERRGFHRHMTEQWLRSTYSNATKCGVAKSSVKCWCSLSLFRSIFGGCAEAPDRLGVFVQPSCEGSRDPSVMYQIKPISFQPAKQTNSKKSTIWRRHAREVSRSTPTKALRDLTFQLFRKENIEPPFPLKILFFGKYLHFCKNENKTKTKHLLA